MSILDSGLRLVPVMLCVAIVLAAVAIASFVVAKILEETDAAHAAHLVLGVVASIGVVVFLVLAAGTEGNHWDQTCHRRGGVVVGPESDVCVRPHSTIDVP